MQTLYQQFAAKLLAAKRLYKEKMGLTYFKDYRVTFEIKQKYAAFYSDEIGHDGEIRNGMILGFVDLTTGDILKPAGYSTPAKTKGKRGNIKDEDGGASAISYQGGIIYLKGGNPTWQ